MTEQLRNLIAALFLTLQVSSVDAACSIPVPSSVPVLVPASGYTARLVANGLNFPRDLIFDSAGHLLVVDRGVGVKSFTLNDQGGTCVGVASSKVVISDTNLNHGIELSADGKTLFASTVNDVFSYPYTPSSATANTASRVQLITNMTNGDHVTRTLTLSKKVANTLLVARGSGANIDPVALDKSAGHAALKSFNLATRGSRVYNYPYDGTLVGWGLRNEVGIAEHPVTGGIYGVENSADDLRRDGVDIHDTNPAEKLNFFGYLNGTASRNFGANFGYPTCFAAWNTSIPNYPGLQTGMQFVTGTSSSAADAACRNNYIAPRLSFDAHQAPLDIKFNPSGTTAFVSMHGSFDRAVAKGYRVCAVAFNSARGDPTLASNYAGACPSIVENPDTGTCNQNRCFRPTGLAFDSKGRLFFTSDFSGGIYIVTKSDGSGL